MCLESEEIDLMSQKGETDNKQTKSKYLGCLMMTTSVRETGKPRQEIGGASVGAFFNRALGIGESHIDKIFELKHKRNERVNCAVNSYKIEAYTWTLQ